MAELTVTFTRAFPNVFTTQVGGIAVGQGCRSEVLTMPDTTTLEADNEDDAVELVADADCWVAIGETPDTGADSSGVRAAHFLKSGIPYQYHVREGHKVAVEAAA